MKRLLFIISFMTIQIMYAVTLVIDQPGLYNLGTDIIEVGANVVEIAVNNVIFDLNEHSLAAGFNGIVVNDNLSNITIRNGNIAQIFNHGISIGQNCSNIRIEGINIGSCGGNGINFASGLVGCFMAGIFINTIGQSAISIAENSETIRAQNFNISNCAGSALELLGTGTGPGEMVSNMLYEQITTASCTLSPTYTHIVRIENARNIVFRELTVSISGNQFNEVRLIEFNNCFNCAVSQSLLTGNSASQLIGMCFNNTQSTIAQGINFIANNATMGDLTGFLFTNSSTSNFIALSRVLTNSSLSGNAIGYNVINGSAKTLFRDCDISELLGKNVIGFNISDSGAPSVYNIFENCQIARCVATTGTVIGFNIDNADHGTLIDSVASYNSAPEGLAAGLLFTGGGGEKWHVNNDKFVRNKGLNDANSYGIFVQTGTDNLFIQNVAFDNGITPANQMNGVPSGSVTFLNPSNLNSANTPWGNIVVTP